MSPPLPQALHAHKHARNPPISVSQPLAAAGGDELLDDDDVLSLTSSDPGASVLLAASPREQEMAVEEEGAATASFSKPPCPAYAELLEVAERTAGRLQLPWERMRKEPVRGREAKAHSAAYKNCIPLRSDPGPRQPGGPGPSRAEAQRQGQKSSVAARAPPPPRSKSQKRRDTRKRKRKIDLRDVIDHQRQLRR
ncbi:hypothetical protein DPX16_21561 [Anabarilius grahami]|uniref:Uncharacterized protein n=1 Tax=Anabarilius grahami TaxID=495550 RepID=A0A3N0XUR4_ANAGA|nr:hypothetical protein DPX16_21561 [Anabarilius grahami]